MEGLRRAEGALVLWAAPPGRRPEAGAASAGAAGALDVVEKLCPRSRLIGERLFYYRGDMEMERWELERFRRSILMVPTGHPAVAVWKAEAEELLAEVERSEGDLASYQQAIEELRRVLSVLESDLGQACQVDWHGCRRVKGVARRAEGGHGA